MIILLRFNILAAVKMEIFMWVFLSGSKLLLHCLLLCAKSRCYVVFINFN